MIIIAIYTEYIQGHSIDHCKYNLLIKKNNKSDDNNNENSKIV